MSQLKLVSISEVKTEKARSDEKVSRQYYSATFSNPLNPFSRNIKRVFWQQHNADGTLAEWKGADPKDVKAFIGKNIPGAIVSSQVEEYEISTPGFEPRMANTYTTVVLDGETPQAVFKAAGKIIVEAAEVAAKTTEPAF